MSDEHLDRHERNLWSTVLAGIAVLVASVIVLISIRAAARNPNNRQRALHGIGRAWGGVESAAGRATVTLRRRKQRLEAEIRDHAGNVLNASDDVPFLPIRRRIPRIHNQFYGHGAFMGAAPALLGDPRWRRILAFLMPDVYRDVQLAVKKGARVGALIPMFENNPVMCAFGVWTHARSARPADQAGPNELAGMEWDIYVDSDRVARWATSTDQALRARLIAEIVDTMVIAHASTTDTVQEQIGLCQWADVRKTAKAQLGGVQPGAWLDLFTRAIRLARVENLDDAIRAMSAEPRSDADEECTKHTFVREISPVDAVREFTALTGKPQMSVILEIKSLRSSPEMLGALVAEMNRRGLHVAGVGSFVLAEIAGVSKMRQVVLGADLPGPREVLFMHYAGDLQAAVDAGSLPDGTSAMFNGASLLDATLVGGQREYNVKESVIEGLSEYRAAHDLHIGLYVQENDCDARAAELLSELAQRRADVFDLGFAWGGLSDEVAIAEGGGDHRGFGPQKYLERLGYAKHWVPKGARATETK